MWEKIVMMIVTYLLNYLKNSAISYAEDVAAQKALDEKRGINDEKNTKAYEEAHSRAERIKAAEALLNGDTVPDAG